MVGAGDRPGSTGGAVLQNLRISGFAGTIIPVNPRGGEMFGLPVRRSLAELNEPADAVVIAIRPDLILDAVREAAATGHRHIVILPGGFAEAGEEGRARDAALRAIVARARPHHRRPQLRRHHPPDARGALRRDVPARHAARPQPKRRHRLHHPVGRAGRGADRRRASHGDSARHGRVGRQRGAAWRRRLSRSPRRRSRDRRRAALYRERRGRGALRRDRAPGRGAEAGGGLDRRPHPAGRRGRQSPHRRRRHGRGGGERVRRARVARPRYVTRTDAARRKRVRRLSARHRQARLRAVELGRAGRALHRRGGVAGPRTRAAAAEDGRAAQGRAAA